MWKKIFLLTFTLLFLGNMVLAVSAPDCPTYCADTASWDPPSGVTCFCNPWESDTLEDLIDRFTNFVFIIATIIAPLLIVYGGFTFITSRGDMEKVNLGKRIIFYTIIGYTIVLLSRGLISTLKSFF